MIQKSSYLKVLEIFFIEPTTIHFIREISKRINLAPTSVRNHIKELQKENLIKPKQAKPFNGFIANRDEDFIFQKRAYNLLTLNNIKKYLTETYYPRLIVVYGSYSLGEDIENSDIDVLIQSKTKKQLNLDKFEKQLKRKIHIITVKDINELDKNIKTKIYNGIVLHGGF